MNHLPEFLQGDKEALFTGEHNRDQFMALDIQMYLDTDVMLKVVILSSPVIIPKTQDSSIFEHLKVINDSFGRYHQPLRDLRHKTGLFPKEFYDPSPVPVSQNIQKSGKLCLFQHH